MTLAVLLTCLHGLPAPAIGAVTARSYAAAGSEPADAQDWVWPLTTFRLERPYAAPAHPYGPGHRGIDLTASVGAAVRSPGPGTVAFVGEVGGRAILTIDHGNGLVTTLEPAESTLSVGAPVTRGQEVATVSVGGHAAPSSLHFGVRQDGQYINPLILLGGIPRAVLLPCC